jgi:hypothetical protein
MGKTLDSEFSHTWDTMTYEGLLQFSEKFAELIVQECISTLEEKIYRSIDHEGDEIWIDLILKEHFGVEE